MMNGVPSDGYQRLSGGDSSDDDWSTRSLAELDAMWDNEYPDVGVDPAKQMDATGIDMLDPSPYRSSISELEPSEELPAEPRSRESSSLSLEWPVGDDPHRDSRWSVHSEAPPGDVASAAEESSVTEHLETPLLGSKAREEASVVRRVFDGFVKWGSRLLLVPAAVVHLGAWTVKSVISAAMLPFLLIPGHRAAVALVTFPFNALIFVAKEIENASQIGPEPIREPSVKETRGLREWKLQKVICEQDVKTREYQLNALNSQRFKLETDLRAFSERWAKAQHGTMPSEKVDLKDSKPYQKKLGELEAINVSLKAAKERLTTERNRLALANANIAYYAYGEQVNKTKEPDLAKARQLFVEIQRLENLVNEAPVPQTPEVPKVPEQVESAEPPKLVSTEGEDELAALKNLGDKERDAMRSQLMVEVMQLARQGVTIEDPRMIALRQKLNALKPPNDA